MTIREVVARAMREGCLSPALETALLRALDFSFQHSEADMAALSALQSAVRKGEIVTRERRRCFNMMEEFVWDVIEQEYATLRMRGAELPDAGDVAAYALNHLRPFYATTEEGAQFQREKAREEYWDLVKKRVREALEHNMGRPVYYPERKPIAPPADKENLLGLLDTFLKKIR